MAGVYGGDWVITKNKRNHFVPKALIKRFSVDKGVRLFDTSSFKLKEQSNPKSIFYVDHLYSRWRGDGTRDMSAEAELQRDHENALTNFLDNLIERMERSEEFRLTESDKEYLLRVAVRLLLRNPQFIEWAGGTWKIRIAKWVWWMSLKLQPRVSAALRKSKLQPLKAAESAVRAYAATFDISNIIEILKKGHHISLMRPTVGSQAFVLGSQPYLLQRKKWSTENDGSMKSRNGVTDVYVVLDPFLMVGIVSSSEIDDVYPVSAEDVRRINGLIVKYSEEIVARSVSDLQGVWYRIFDGEEKLRIVKKLPEGTTEVKLTVETANEATP